MVFVVFGREDARYHGVVIARKKGAMLGGQMAGGGIGVAVREELILMHTVLEMSSAADPNSLRRFAPLFVEAVEKWRVKAKDLLEGREEFTPRDWGAPPDNNSSSNKATRPRVARQMILSQAITSKKSNPRLCLKLRKPSF